MDAKLNAIVSVRGRKIRQYAFVILQYIDFVFKFIRGRVARIIFVQKNQISKPVRTCNAFESKLIFFHNCLSLLVLCLPFVLFNFCSTEVTVAEDSDDEFAYEEVRYSCMRYELTL